VDKNSYKILVVDDEKDNRRIVTKILQGSGYKIQQAPDGLSALNLVNKEKFDLILLDIMMPIMNGIDTCRYLKKNLTTSNIPIIFLTASDDTQTLTKAYGVGGSDYIKKPFFKEELLARVHSRLQLRDYEKNLESEVQKRTKEMADTQIQLMYTLGAIAEGHSKETHLHVRRVAEFTYKLAILSGLNEEESQRLKNASSLHDIGKLGIHGYLLHKKDILSNNEYKEIKKHALLGAKMLEHSKLPLFRTARIVCEQHHEKWDGSGYPRGLKGRNIHIYGRIVAIADVYDALSFGRSYKSSWSQAEVLKFILDMKGKHFDPALVDIFLENIDQFLSIYNTNMKEISLTKNSSKKKTPTQKIFNWLLKER